MTPPFQNLRVAGTPLAEALRKQDLSNAVVLAIARGGVPTGHEVATELGLPFDLVLIRRLLVPNGPGSELCAVNVAGNSIVDKEIGLPDVCMTPLDHFLTDALRAFRDREEICRRGVPAVELEGRSVLLVDCAIHTGSTMKIAVRALRRLRPQRITAAVPVGSHEGAELVAPLVDELVCLAKPEPFGHAGLWYKDFQRPADEELYSFLGLRS
jgi:putative phosphoribosyl transferase